MARGFKTGGRAKGTPNKITAEQRAIVKALLDKKLPELEDGAALREIQAKIGPRYGVGPGDSVDGETGEIVRAPRLTDAATS